MSVTATLETNCTGVVPLFGSVLSFTVDALSVPTSPGGSLTGSTSMVIVLGVVSNAPRASRTEKVKSAKSVPFASAGGT